MLSLEIDSVLLDLSSNVPLKLYQFSKHELDQLVSGDTNWVPDLRMSGDESEIIHTDGTVCVLGRSGTGKTICISNRMAKDRQAHSYKQEFRQLFVARSRHITRMVREMQKATSTEEQLHGRSFFMSLEDLMTFCERNIPVKEGEALRTLPVNKYINYRKFTADFFYNPSINKKQKKEIDVLVVWTQIKSCIKGNIEAVIAGRPLTQQEYLKLGKEACRLDRETREAVYYVYEKYAAHAEQEGWWDDIDRVFEIFRKQLDPQTYIRDVAMRGGVLPPWSFNKLYVDEVQDYTQADLALFVMMCDPKSLFVGGDTAQSVVEGVQFRFTDIRSVVYHLSNKDSSAVPQKRKELTVNFRSHSGILNIAAEVLERLLLCYPGSMDNLPKDEGLFKGPKPTMLLLDTDQSLECVLGRNQRITVLCRDEGKERVKEMCRPANGGDFYPNQVYGIRESKGLEFHEVVIVNFFQDLREEHQPAWKRMLRAGAPMQEYPELEWELKTLYTGITRCQHRLMFLESKFPDRKSAAATAFFTLLSDKKLAEQHKVTEDTADKFLSTDEWRMEGIKLSLRAEDAADHLEAVAFHERALKCYQQAADPFMENRASIQIEVSNFMASLYQVSELTPALQKDCIELLNKLFEAKLLGDALKLCKIAAPLMPATNQPIFRSNVVLPIERLLGLNFSVPVAGRSY